MGGDTNAQTIIRYEKFSIKWGFYTASYFSGQVDVK